MVEGGGELEELLGRLTDRFSRGEHLTSLGPDVTVSLNPFSSRRDEASNDTDSNSGPSVRGLALAAATRSGVFSGSRGIVLTGESGAGKTTACREAIDAIASLAERSCEDSGLSEKLQLVEPVLDSLGNARTARNEDSSRFGKLVTVSLDPSTRAVRGAALRTFLLEKSRVTRHAASESSFRAFYELIAWAGSDLPGCTPECREDLTAAARAPAGGPLGGFVERCRAFAYLRPWDGPVDGSADEPRSAERWAVVRRGLEALGTPARKVESVLAAVLHLGNIAFEDAAGEAASGEGAAAGGAAAGDAAGAARVARSDDGRSARSLEKAASLLGVPTQRLESLFTHRTVSIARRTVYQVPQSVSEAESSRDALATAVYTRVFDVVIAAMNRTLAGDSTAGTAHATVHILDIYGFESLPNNSLEQLCINLANEDLQRVFLDHLFRADAREYDEEGIPRSTVRFADNAEVIALLHSIAAVADDECFVPRGSDAGMVQRLHAQHGGHSLYSAPRFRAAEAFSVTHTMGSVEYAANGFLEKNRDALHTDQITVLAASSDDFVASLVAVPGDSDNAGSGGGAGGAGGAGGNGGAAGGKQSARAPTVLRSFRESLAGLATALAGVQLHFVRCVKTNTAREPWTIDPETVRRQLISAGVLSVVEAASLSHHPQRMDHAAFVERYAPAVVSHATARGGDPQRILADALSRAGDQSGAIGARCAVGRTRFFLTDEAAETLEAERTRVVAHSARIVQDAARVFLACRRLARLRSEKREREEEERRRIEMEREEEERRRIEKEREEEERRRIEKEREEEERRRIEKEREEEEMARKEREEMERKEEEERRKRAEAEEEQRKRKEAEEGEKEEEDGSKSRDAQEAQPAPPPPPPPPSTAPPSVPPPPTVLPPPTVSERQSGQREQQQQAALLSAAGPGRRGSKRQPSFLVGQDKSVRGADDGARRRHDPPGSGTGSLGVPQRGVSIAEVRQSLLVRRESALVVAVEPAVRAGTSVGTDWRAPRGTEATAVPLPGRAGSAIHIGIDPLLVPRTATATHRFDPCDEDELPLVPGEHVTVILQHDSGWWLARRVDDPQGREGLVPSSHLCLTESLAAGVARERHKSGLVVSSDPLGVGGGDADSGADPGSPVAEGPKGDGAEAAAEAREAREARRRATRARVCEEIISSEEIYVHKIQWATAHYVRPARALQLLDDAEASQLFSNLEMIQRLNEDLLDQLRRCGPGGPIGSVFQTAAPTLKLYSVYVNNYPVSLSLLGTLATREPWRRFIDSLEGAPDSLESLLIMPVQRVCRYELLLREAVKYTDATHTDHASLTSALAEVSRIAGAINESKAKHERIQRVLEIQRQFLPCAEVLDLVQPHRRFVRQDLLVKKPTEKPNESAGAADGDAGPGSQERRGGAADAGQQPGSGSGSRKRRLLRRLGQRRARSRWFFLFSDTLWYASPSRLKSSKFELKGRIPLEEATVAAVPDDPREGVAHALEVSHPGGRCVVQFDTDAARDEYVADVRALILEVIAQRIAREKAHHQHHQNKRKN